MSFENYLRTLQGLGSTVEDIGKEREKKLAIEAQGRAIAEAMKAASGPSLAFTTGPAQEAPYTQPTYVPGAIKGAAQPAAAPFTPDMLLPQYGVPTGEKPRIPLPPITRQTIPGEQIVSPIDKGAKLRAMIANDPANAAAYIAAFSNEETRLQKQIDRFSETGHDSDNPGKTPQERAYFDRIKGEPAREALRKGILLKDAQLRTAQETAALAALDTAPKTPTKEDELYTKGALLAGQSVPYKRWSDEMRKARDFEERRTLAEIAASGRKTAAEIKAEGPQPSEADKNLAKLAGMGKVNYAEWGKRGGVQEKMDKAFFDIYPNGDTNKLRANMKAMGDVTRIRSISNVNAVLPRLKDIQDMFNAQKNGDIQLFNKVKNKYKTWIGDAAYTRTEYARDTAAQEMMVALANSSQGSDLRVNLDRLGLDPLNMSPAQFQEAINVATNALGTKMDANKMVPYKWEEVRGEGATSASATLPAPVEGEKANGYTFKNGKWVKD